MNQIYIYPTDTVWGIGGVFHSKDVFDRILEIKKCPEPRPFSILFPHVDKIEEYFSLPEFLGSEWLRKFFVLESTLALPVAWAKKELPSWIHYNSPLIAIRALGYPLVKSIYNECGAPFISTSLNLSGEDPIVERESATKFFQEYGKDCKLMDDKSIQPSGNSSSIMRVGEKGFEGWLRKGNLFQKIEDELGLPSA